MKKVYLLGLATATLFSANAQDCSGGRYDTEMFSDVVVDSNILYGSNENLAGDQENLLLDIYQPNGDTETKRPLIIFMHGGTFVAGSKTGDDVVPLAEMYAKKGYVTSSIDYRLGMNGIPFPGPDEADASEAVMRATQDLKGAIRFFKKSVSDEGNPYEIDTTNILLVGSSAGGFMALHHAYLDQESEIPLYIDMTDPTLTGGLEGTSGNPGHTTDDIKAIVSLSGALGDTTWMAGNTTPVLSLHGDQDGTVPYGSDVITVGPYDIMEVDGSQSVHKRADNLNIKNCFKTEKGADHVPHVDSQAYLDTAEMFITQFFLSEVCGETEYCYNAQSSGVKENLLSENLQVYPNPALNEITVSIEDGTMNHIQILAVSGKVVYDAPVENNYETINIHSLNSGIYFVKVSSGNAFVTKKIIVK